MASLLEALEARLDGPLPADERPRVAAVLADLLRRGRLAWPGLAVTDEAFAACVAVRVRGSARLLDALSALPADDLVLVTACAHGDAGAIEMFEERYFRPAREALRRMRCDAAVIDDLLQRLRERLFVAPGGELPRICGLVGGGDLGALVRIAAVRLGLNAARDDRRSDDDPESLLERLAIDLDPEAELIAAHARSALARAFTDTLAALTARDRTVLRLHLVHGLAIDEIGATFRVHRSTAARWLAKIRSDLEEGTLKLLRERLDLSEGEAASLARLLQSRLEISFSRVLAPD
ncbi:sigma factor-like helix-turn-helix DNA-binding protein [Nannocystis radixulma]|uniref:Sigma factor-like helix-turn-helix DNA-binding protein n=1 Tax=Nannocystis radixulma TaxID=2995305 RepID=A0ABT5BEM1_9BACT|nr:sigma factor-like helix-turn-helix DNA-binding protein [Nannocystis radixulma]MDC0671954.1 sigma factor-like helix-turn-helix DNA-binding protein [Nannocystis radixulma]